MRCIIAGDRDINEDDLHLINIAVQQSGFHITTVISGKAQGGDRLGEKWAKLNKIRVQEFPADWKDLTVPGAVIKTGKFGPYNAKAGFDRNQDMADAAEALIALQPNGDSSGTQDMIERARKKGIPVFVYPPNKHTDTSATGQYCYEF